MPLKNSGDGPLQNQLFLQQGNRIEATSSLRKNNIITVSKCLSKETIYHVYIIKSTILYAHVQ